MTKVKTIRGLIGKLKKVADISPDELKGYEKLTEHQKEVLAFLIGECYNYIGEMNDMISK